MSRKIQRRGVAAAVLILTLVLGSPAHAAGLPDWGHVPTLFHQAWQWLASVLPGAGPLPEGRPAAPAQGSGPRKSLTGAAPADPTLEPAADKGAGVDPNG
jgi:hypothetical protein